MTLLCYSAGTRSCADANFLFHHATAFLPHKQRCVATPAWLCIALMGNMHILSCLLHADIHDVLSHLSESRRHRVRLCLQVESAARTPATPQFLDRAGGKQAGRP